VLTEEDKQWISERLGKVETALLAGFSERLEEVETTLRTEFGERLEKVETTLLTEFHKWASPVIASAEPCRGGSRAGCRS
jgi:hypothetical protein